VFGETWETQENTSQNFCKGTAFVCDVESCFNLNLSEEETNFFFSVHVSIRSSLLYRQCDMLRPSC
jgi:hypothetical protein